MNSDDSQQSVLATTKPLSRSAQRALDNANRLAKKRKQLIATALIVALALSVLISKSLYQYLVINVQDARIAEMTEHETQNRTQAVTDYLAQITRQIKEEAKRETVAEALLKNDENELSLFEQSINKSFYKALKVRLIPIGQASLDRDSHAPIRFAELDMIRNAELGRKVLPELSNVDGHWQLNIISAVSETGSKNTLGTLMVSLDSDELFQRFNVGDDNLGESKLLQNFPGAGVQTVLAVGNAASSVSREYTIDNSYLSVKFTPSAQLYLAATQTLIWWLLVSLLIAVALVAAFWFACKLALGIDQVGKAVGNTDALNKLVPPKNKEENKLPLVDTVSNSIFQNTGILDVEILEDDDDVLGFNQDLSKRRASIAQTEEDDTSVPTDIFRSYDIRGVVGTALTLSLAEDIGRALGSEAQEQGESYIIVARDGRIHSEALTEKLIAGITQSGCSVIDIGVVPTPILYFATFHLPETNSGVMVTASHNPKEYNGFKMVIDGVTLADDAVMNIRQRIVAKRYLKGRGDIEYRQIVGDYIDRIFSDVALAGNLHIVVDAGNAVTGLVAPQLFEELGCEVTPLFCDLDGEFPNHEPDPCHEQNLVALIEKVKEVGADLGVAFDGDGDRLVAVTGSGKIIWPDQLLMLFARDVLSRHPGADILFDVKCSRQLNEVISSYGGRPIMWKTGHSPMKAKMIETGALIGGEYSGHIFIKDRWYGFDDGMYAMARLMEIITLRDQTLDQAFEAFPLLPATPEIKIVVEEHQKLPIIEALIARGDFQNGKHTTIDGLRVDFSKGWGLVRASNTSPALTLRFEAESEEILKTIQELFKRELLKIDSNLAINF